MKKILTIIFSLLVFSCFGQRNEAIFTVPNDTTQFGTIKANGTIVLNKENNKIYQLEQKAVDTSKLSILSLSQDSTLFMRQIQLAVKDCVNVTLADTWLNVKMDTTFNDLSTYGFRLNNDSTGIICGFTNTVMAKGRAVLTNNSAGLVSSNIKFVLYKNSEQIPSISTNTTRSFAANGSITLISPSFSFLVNENDTLYPKAKIGNANIDLDFSDEDIQPKFPFILEIKEVKVRK